mgnify:FL=1
MRFYRAQKDYNRAALIYRGLHKAMADTLGIAPLKDTSELYYSIMKTSLDKGTQRKTTENELPSLTQCTA